MTFLPSGTGRGSAFAKKTSRHDRTERRRHPRDEHPHAHHHILCDCGYRIPDRFPVLQAAHPRDTEDSSQDIHKMGQLHHQREGAPQHFPPYPAGNLPVRIPPAVPGADTVDCPDIQIVLHLHHHHILPARLRVHHFPVRHIQRVRLAEEQANEGRLPDAEGHCRVHRGDTYHRLADKQGLHSPAHRTWSHGHRADAGVP